jgi:hypothetical protein
MKRKQIWVDEFMNVNKKIDDFESKYGKPTLARLYADIRTARETVRQIKENPLLFGLSNNHNAEIVELICNRNTSYVVYAYGERSEPMQTSLGI